MPQSSNPNPSNQAPEPSGSENPEIILQEAKKLFRKKGYSGTSLSDIVKATNLSKPTIYHYFGDKENLYAEVMIDLLKNGYKHLKSGFKPQVKIREQLLHLTEGFMANSPASIVSLLKDAQEQLKPINYKKISDAYRYYMVSTFEVFFSRGVDMGELKDEHSPTDMALLYMSVIDSYTSNKTAYSGREFDYKESSEFIVSALMDGLSKYKNNTTP